jgi:hypothetical protein
MVMASLSTDYFPQFGQTQNGHPKEKSWGKGKEFLPPLSSISISISSPLPNCAVRVFVVLFRENLEKEFPTCRIHQQLKISLALIPINSLAFFFVLVGSGAEKTFTAGLIQFNANERAFPASIVMMEAWKL